MSTSITPDDKEVYQPFLVIQILKPLFIIPSLSFLDIKTSQNNIRTNSQT